MVKDVLHFHFASISANQEGKKIGWKCYVSRDVMDSKISQFVSQTGADAAVAKDLLQRTYFKKDEINFETLHEKYYCKDNY